MGGDGGVSVRTLLSRFGSSRRRHPMRAEDVLITPADTQFTGLGSTPSSKENPNPIN